MNNNAKEWIARLRTKDLLLFVLGIIVVFSIFGYFFNSTFQDLFYIGRKGTLKLELPLIQTNIFIDEEKKITTTKENEVVEFSLSAKKHSIIISRSGYYPWIKEVTVQNKKIIKLSPIFVMINTTGQIIRSTDTEYWKIKMEVVGNILPTESTPISSNDKSRTLWVDDNAILVNTASSTEIVLKPETKIRNVSFYKNRSDSVIFSTSNGIYVIEVEKSGKQNFMPIYKGTSPVFYKDSSGYIYVWDNRTLMQVII